MSRYEHTVVGWVLRLDRRDVLSREVLPPAEVWIGPTEGEDDQLEGERGGGLVVSSGRAVIGWYDSETWPLYS